METKESLMEHVSSVDNLVDISTKVVSGGAKRKQLIGKVLHELYEQLCVENCIHQYKSVDVHLWIYIADGTEY